MTNVHQLFSDLDAQQKQVEESKTAFDGGGGGGYDGRMEARVAKLEDFVVDARDRLTRIESRLDHTATKADLHKEINAQTWKLVTFVCGFGGLLTAAVYFIAKHAAA